MPNFSCLSRAKIVEFGYCTFVGYVLKYCYKKYLV